MARADRPVAVPCSLADVSALKEAGASLDNARRRNPSHFVDFDRPRGPRATLRWKPEPTGVKAVADPQGSAPHRRHGFTRRNTERRLPAEVPRVAALQAGGAPGAVR
jgi:hypothetical protein